MFVTSGVIMFYICIINKISDYEHNQSVLYFKQPKKIVLVI